MGGLSRVGSFRAEAVGEGQGNAGNGNPVFPLLDGIPGQPGKRNS